MPDPHPHLTMFFAVWAAIGPLAGVLIGHLLTRSWQRKQWLLDARKQEFKELVSTLNSEAIAYIQFLAAKKVKSQDVSKRRDAFREAHSATLQVISDRVYIAKDILEMKVSERFRLIMTKRINEDGEPDKDVEPLYLLTNAIVARALQT